MDVSPGYWLTRLALQRGLAFIYLISFLVVLNQFRPLCGEHGLVSAPQFIRDTPFRAAPSIFYLFPRDWAFAFCCSPNWERGDEAWLVFEWLRSSCGE